MDRRTIDFILENADADVSGLLLGASKFPDINMALAAQTIQARSRIKTKIPSWHSFPELEFPISLSLEQCSSEATARYKQRFLNENDTAADLTGGLGVDSFFLAQKCAKVDYFERNQALADAARNNFRILKSDNIFVYNSNINSSIIDNKEFSHYNLIFLDPARRGKIGEKIYSIKECEPNILELKESLFKKTSKLLVKISPMADISATIALLPETSEVHIISVDNECKEVLLLLENNHCGEPDIFAVNIAKGKCLDFRFRQSEENGCSCELGLPEGANLLFEPNRSVLKGGAFKLAAARFGLSKLAPSTHLYVGRSPISDFPGKVLTIKEITDFNKQTIKVLAKSCPKASVTSRNFPIGSNELQKRLKISDGGNNHIFACTLLNGEKKLIITEQ